MESAPRSQEDIAKDLEELDKAWPSGDLELLSADEAAKAIEEMEAAQLHSFGWAVDHIVAGGFVVRKCWFHNRNYLALGTRGRKKLIMQFSIVHKELCEWVPNHDDILATDWMEFKK